MLEELERVGRWLATAATQLGSDLGTITEQIRLTLQDLRDSKAMWRGEVPPGRKAVILRECYHDWSFTVLT